MPEYRDVGCVVSIDIFGDGADNDKNVEKETSLRVEAQRVSGCGCGEPAKRYGCILVYRRAKAFWVSRWSSRRPVCSGCSLRSAAIIRCREKSKDTNNKNGLGLGVVQLR